MIPADIGKVAMLEGMARGYWLGFQTGQRTRKRNTRDETIVQSFYQATQFARWLYRFAGMRDQLIEHSEAFRAAMLAAAGPKGSTLTEE